jgi:hypothetical protein
VHFTVRINLQRKFKQENLQNMECLVHSLHLFIELPFHKFDLCSFYFGMNALLLLFVFLNSQK